MLLDSESPPASPSWRLDTDMREEESVFRWDCSARTSLSSKVSLKSVRNGELCINNKQQLTVKLPSTIFSVVTGCRHDTDHLPHLMTGFCQHWSLLQLSQDRRVRRQSAWQLICSVNHVRNIVITRLSEGQDISAEVMDWIRDVVYQVGSIVSSDEDEQMTREVLHVWLETRWRMIQILSIIPAQTREALLVCPLPTQSWLHQIITATLLDLLHLSVRRLFSLEVTYKSVTQLSLFQCPCVEEFWICLHELCQGKDINIFNFLEACLSSQESPEFTDEYDLSRLNYTLPVTENSTMLLFLNSFISLLHSSQSLTEDKRRSSEAFTKKLIKVCLSELSEKQDEAKLRQMMAGLMY